MILWSPTPNVRTISVVSRVDRSDSGEANDDSCHSWRSSLRCIGGLKKKLEPNDVFEISVDMTKTTAIRNIEELKDKSDYHYVTSRVDGIRPYGLLIKEIEEPTLCCSIM